MRSNTANMQIHAVFCYREGVLKIYIQTTTWHCVWGSQRGWERTPTSVICSSCSSNGLPSFLLKNVAMPTISSFLLTMGSDRTFLMTNPVSSTASFWKTRRCVLYVLCFRVMCINHPREEKVPHLESEVVVCSHIHHVANLQAVTKKYFHMYQQF